LQRKVKLSFDFAGRKIVPKLNAPPEPAAAAAEGEEDSPEEASVGKAAR